MTRLQLEHVVRAAGAIAQSDELVVIGSQAILGAHPDAPAELLTSREVDLYPRDDPEKAILIDGSIGEGSLFDEQFMYYAHGVGPETAKLPLGWQERLVPVQTPYTRGVTAWCLHPTDIAVSKLMAGRDKDLVFVRGLLQHALLTEAEIQAATDGLAAPAKELARERLGLCAAAPTP